MKASTWLLIAGNLSVLWSAFFGGADAAALLLLYVAETAVIGIISGIEVYLWAHSRYKAQTVFLYVTAVGGGTLALSFLYGSFIASLLAQDLSTMVLARDAAIIAGYLPALYLPLFLLLGSRIYALIVEYIVPRAYEQASFQQLIVLPLSRVPIFLLISGIGIFAFFIFGGVGLLVLIVLAKTVLDVWFDPKGFRALPLPYAQSGL